MTEEPDPHEYYFDLRHKATVRGGAPADGLAVLADLTADRTTANPVFVVQFGLGALQLRDPAWLDAVARTVEWVQQEAGDDGLLEYRFPMQHTFPLAPPWPSALSQGEAASLLVRAARVLDAPDLLAVAVRVARLLLDASSPLVVVTPEGVVLEEYPTATPSFVLNGWITALWGLRDLAAAPVPADVSRNAAEAFESGVDTVAARLPLYRCRRAWSRYDLYPHPLVNVASPYYHGVHISHLRTLSGHAPRPAFEQIAAEWERGAASPVSRALALARKAAFRAVRPRGRLVAA